MNVEAFLNDIQDNQWNIYGLEVYEDDRVVFSYGDTTQNRHPIYSATKTITSIAAGMAMDEGKLDLDRTILTYLPDRITRNMSENQKKAYSQVTTKRLLTMSVQGYPFATSGASWLCEALKIPLPYVNEKIFKYSNVSAYLAGVAVAGAVNEDLYTYLNRKLFTSLGITSPAYLRCPDGYFYGASKMELTVQELSRIGLLLSHGGCYQGQRILSQTYVNEATALQIENNDGGYGYFIWKYPDGFGIHGKWNQRCLVLPQKKKVITYLTHIEDDTCGLQESAERNLI